MAKPLTLNISGLTVPQMKEVAMMVKGFEKGGPDHDFLIWVSGTERWNKEKASQLVQDLMSNEGKIATIRKGLTNELHAQYHLAEERAMSKLGYETIKPIERICGIGVYLQCCALTEHLDRAKE